MTKDIFDDISLGDSVTINDFEFKVVQLDTGDDEKPAKIVLFSRLEITMEELFQIREGGNDDES